MTDAAMAARAECVMLNKGSHVSEAVTLLDGMLARMDEHMFRKTPTLRALKSWQAAPVHARMRAGIRSGGLRPISTAAPAVWRARGRAIWGRRMRTA